MRDTLMKPEAPREQGRQREAKHSNSVELRQMVVHVSDEVAERLAREGLLGGSPPVSAPAQHVAEPLSHRLGRWLFRMTGIFLTSAVVGAWADGCIHMALAENEPRAKSQTMPVTPQRLALRRAVEAFPVTSQAPERAELLANSRVCFALKPGAPLMKGGGAPPPTPASPAGGVQ